jgi:tetratricopeptide (TPR) repeat protein
MDGNAQKQIFRLIGLTIAILLLCGINSPAQDKPSPLSDYQYTKFDLPRYEKTLKEPNTQTRADYWIIFIKERPISKLLALLVNDYLACIKPTIEKDPAKAVSMIEEAMALLPTEEAVKAANIPTGAEDFLKSQLAPSQDTLVKTLYAVHVQSKNYPKAAEVLEKLYAKNPDNNYLFELAKVYKLFNNEKYLEYGQKIIAVLPIEQSFVVAFELAPEYIKKQDMKTATELLTKVLNVYGDKVPPNVQEPAWNASRAWAYNVLASGALSGKDYPKAAELFEKVIKFDPKKEEAHYYLAQSKWRMKDYEGAINAFAKCVVLGGSTSAKAKETMESLYKPTHNNTLDGIDEVLAKAKADLGIK